MTRRLSRRPGGSTASTGGRLVRLRAGVLTCCIRLAHSSGTDGTWRDIWHFVPVPGRDGRDTPPRGVPFVPVSRLSGLIVRPTAKSFDAPRSRAG
jgi:hypothetical protein